MPVNFNLLRQAGPANLAEGLMQGQEQQNALFQQQQQRQVGEIQLRNALRAEQEALAESEAAKGSMSLEDLAKRQRQAGLGKQALATEAAIGKQRTDRLNAAKTQIELMKASAGQIMANPESAVQVLNRFGQMTGMDMSDDIRQIQNMDPETIKNWAAGHALDADKLLPKFETRDLGGTVERQAYSVVTGAPIGAPVVQQKTATPGELMVDARAKENQINQLAHWDTLSQIERDRLAETFRNNNLTDKRARDQLSETIKNNLRVDARAMANLALEKQKFAQTELQASQPKYDSAAGGYVFPPSKENPQGKFVPVTGLDGKPLNEAQGNSVAYGIRMKEANSIIKKLAEEGVTRQSAGAGAPYGIGGIINALPSALGGANPKQQQVYQAKLNFITAILRKESGAAIGSDEFEREDQKYFPQIGDSDAVKAQKAQARQTAIKAMEIQAGPGAKEIQKFEPRTESSQTVSAPKIGAVQDGYKFKGGDPSKPSSWEKL